MNNAAVRPETAAEVNPPADVVAKAKRLAETLYDEWEYLRYLIKHKEAELRALRCNHDDLLVQYLRSITGTSIS